MIYVLFVLLLLAVSGIAGYAHGRQVGFELGRQNGLEIGSIEGHKRGFNEGVAKGQDTERQAMTERLQIVANNAGNNNFVPSTNNAAPAKVQQQPQHQSAVKPVRQKQWC